MKPVIALVGRPNVGKSTLFNKLTRSQDALVADFPGLTRDRQYGDGRVGGWPYLLVDTGGLSGEPETLDAAMADQTLLAVKEADVVVFLVDGRDGLVATDRDIADLLRREAGRVVLCVNKIDGIGEDRAQLEFHELGFEAIAPTAASHNRGVQNLVEVIADLLEIPAEARIDEGPRRRRKRARASKPDFSRERGETGDGAAIDDVGGGDAAGDGGARSEGVERGALGEGVEGGASGDGAVDGSEAGVPEPPHEVRIAFVGRPNVGKSTLINRLLGEERLVAYDKPGTTRDAVSVPFERAGRDYTLIDTAGVRRRGKVSEKVEIFSIIKTLQAVDRSQVCVMLVDANDGVTDQDLSLLGYIIDKGRALVVAINKWDSIGPEDREALRERLEERVEFLRFTRIHFISALHGSGVGDVFKSINRAHASAFVDLSTPRLTRLLEVAVTSNPPPMAGGRRIKLRYAHQGGQNPPIVVIHGNQADKVPQNYQRYLMNYFMKALRLFGTPLRIELRQGSNPFAGRRVKKVFGKEAAAAARKKGREQGRDKGRDKGRETGRDKGRDGGRDGGRDTGRDKDRSPAGGAVRAKRSGSVTRGRARPGGRGGRG